MIVCHRLRARLARLSPGKTCFTLGKSVQQLYLKCYPITLTEPLKDLLIITNVITNC